MIAFIILVIGVIFWKLLLDPDPLDKLPGPSKTPILGSAITLYNISPRDLFVTHRRYFKEYGSRFVVKILHKRILHLSRPEDIETVLSHSKNIKKGLSYTLLTPWLGSGLLVSTGLKWHARRKILTPTFHFNILKSFASIIEVKSESLIRKLAASAGEDVDVMKVTSEFTLATICETAMGTKIDSDTSAKTEEYTRAVMDVGTASVKRLCNGLLMIDFIFNMSSLGRHFYSRLAKINNFVDNVIAKRREKRGDFFAAIEGRNSTSKTRLAMLDLLLDAEDKGEIDAKSIRDEVNTFMFEGYDTTALALTYAIWLLSQHEDVQDNILEEYKTVAGNSVKRSTVADWAQMKYLEAVIKETLRLYPSVPYLGRTIVEDFMLDAVAVRAGTEVSVHIFDLHRRAELFPAPEQFRPERFLAAPPRHPYAYVPFSAGLRNCIGQKFALMEMKCVLSDIVRSFRLKPADKASPLELTNDLVLRPLNPLYVKFVPR